MRTKIPRKICMVHRMTSQSHKIWCSQVKIIYIYFYSKYWFWKLRVQMDQTDAKYNCCGFYLFQRLFFLHAHNVLNQFVVQPKHSTSSKALRADLRPSTARLVRSLSRTCIGAPQPFQLAWLPCLLKRDCTPNL
jgi:hypothetical protein